MTRRCLACGREDATGLEVCVCGVEGAWEPTEGTSADGFDSDPPATAFCLADAEPADVSRVPTGCAPLDRLLAGGWAPGRSTVLHGPAGSGKTTHALAWAPKPVMVVSLEMPADLLRETAERAGVDAARVYYVGEPGGWQHAADRFRCRSVVLDSASVAGDEVRATRAVVDYCRARGAVGLVITHENKRGQAAGAAGVVYWVDAELVLRRPKPDRLRARLKKCRWAPAPASCDLTPRGQGTP